ncbi:protein kinase domain-containing protein [Neorhodopirellula pilleata]|uniref:protein kinase domain-containing protein n=1 Tax=Neorhodopirellula pilleata TaxID=2714738 RepID=UPI0018CCEA5A|nr:DKNYY domain-containing protein [Neorhodopirellula pilleata]
MERLIGSGGMGVVFKAFDTELNRPIAIKLLAPYLASSGPARKRFAREARAAAAVVHPHVVPIHNVETERESPFIVMQYVSGESLQARIDRDGALELCEILRIGMQIADGLSAAHQQGIVHRDIKPSNILLEEDVDRALISDFGLARAADDASLTRTGFHPGTPQYMSPEQASGQSVDARSDLFSLGSMLYTMCTGRPPFRAENSLSIMRRITESEPTPIQEINPNIPEWMSAVITKLMTKSVQDRLSSAAEVRELLEVLLSYVQQPLSNSLPTLPWLLSSEAAPKTSESKRRWLNMKTLVLGNSLLIAFAAFLMLPTDPVPVQQNGASTQGTHGDNGDLSQEEKARLERLTKNSPLIVVGKLQEGEPTGSAMSHLFEASQFLKGKPITIDALFSNVAAIDPVDPIANQTPTGNLPRLNAGEYLLVLEQKEVTSSFAVSIFGLNVTPEKTFNRFIIRDGNQHAAWPVNSPQAVYIRQFLTLLQSKETDKEVLGHGYSRQGDFIYFKEQRIDQAGREDFDRFAKSTNLKLTPCADVDAASFKALSEEYTKDKNKVYYKWISNERFWVVELPLADAQSFEVISSNLAKDATSAWWYGEPLRGVDPKTVELVNAGFAWKDAKSVWYQREKISGADAKTFRHLKQAFYRDANRVYWSMTPLEGVDLDTFRTFGDDSPYAADRRSVWKGNSRINGYDAPTFQAIHQSVIKDKNGVYAGDYLIENADPKSFLKIADLDTSLSALLADEHQYYVFLPYYGDVYQVTSTANSLNVKRSIWPPGIKQKDPVAIATAELGETGWKNLNIAADPAINTAQLQDRETHLLNIYTAQFTKAWEIIRERKIQNNSVAQTTREEQIAQEDQPEKGKPSSEGWRADIVAFDTYLGELAGKARVPDEPSLEKRVTVVPAAGETNSEVLPVTDGAGGYVDMAPAEDTVQFQVNKALKGQNVKWEFELAHVATKSFNGVAHLMPKSVINANANPFLATLIIDTSDELEFKAGDIVKLEGTIGDASENKGLGGLLKPSGPVAVYHLDSSPHTVFWLGLENVKISGPTRKTTARLQPAPEVTAFAKELLRACMLYDEKKLDQLYASEVQLLPGNRLFYFGLEVPGKMTEYGVSIKRDEMLVALKKQAAVDPIPSVFIGQFMNLYRIEQLDVAVGDYATEPNQPSESLFQSMRFKIKENDVLLKISAGGACRFVQLRKADEQWKVIAEY